MLGRVYVKKPKLLHDMEYSLNQLQAPIKHIWESQTLF